MMKAKLKRDPFEPIFNTFELKVWIRCDSAEVSSAWHSWQDAISKENEEYQSRENWGINKSGVMILLSLAEEDREFCKIATKKCQVTIAFKRRRVWNFETFELGEGNDTNYPFSFIS